jgi:gluconate 5-dehydrogenase
VVVASRDDTTCSRFVARLRERLPGAKAHARRVDITDPASIRTLFSDVRDAVGDGLDILVNSGWSGRKNTFESIDDEDWDHDIDVCLNGVFRTIRAAFPMLRRRRGAILTIASMYGHVAPDHRLYEGTPFANPPSYGAAKAGIVQLTRYLASFLAPHGIRANCISPGPFPFETTQMERPDFIERLNAKTPLNRIGRPHEIKGAAVLLCSDAGSYITGQDVRVDGGWTIW